MTKKAILEMFCEMYNNGSHQAYEVTRTFAQIDEEYDRIRIRNLNDSEDCFYHIEDVARIAQGLDLSAYARINDDKLEIIVH